MATAITHGQYWEGSTMMERGWEALVHAMARAHSTDTPLLPLLAGQQIWMHIAWTLVLAWVVAVLLRRWTVGPWMPGAAIGLAVLCSYLPGAYAPHHWLGLAFQAPSLTTAGLCVAALLRMVVRPEQKRGHRLPSINPGLAGVALVAIGISTGWLLLLDTLALLPGIQLYAWGFSPAAPGVLLLVALLPWLVFHTSLAAFLSAAVAATAAATIFMVWHLPSGNAWDTVLDPWLWVILHVRAWQLARHR